MAELLRIALLVSRASGHGRGVLRGARAWSLGRPWVCRQAEPHIVPPERIAAWQPDGIITDMNGHRTVRDLLSTGVPTVDVALVAAQPSHACVGCDCRAAGELAAQHFLERGFRHFAFVGCHDRPCSEHCFQGFARVVRGMDYPVARNPGTSYGGAHWSDSWLDCPDDEGLMKWLTVLDRPVGVMTCCDEAGVHVAAMARRAALRVPEDVAVVGFGDDELVCELASPPLSSVKVPSERIGYEAAAMLERLIAGGSARAEAAALPPIGVVARASSDLLPFADPVLAAALRFIRQHAHEAIGVADVLKEVSVSRRSLERRFRETIHRSPLDEITRARIQRARELLGGTDLAMPAVARGAGFANHQWFSTVFRRETGMAPMAYRRQFRVTTPAPR